MPVKMKKEEMQVRELKKIAARARQLMVEMLICAGCGHPGGAFSSIDIMTTLYFAVMKIDPQNPHWEGRDRFILSKGHSSLGLYAVLHLRGFMDKETLLTFRQDNSLLCGHPDMHKVTGVEMSTGSLGHGLSVGTGLAIAAKFDRKGHRVFVLMGDGETQEGSIWEAAMFASHHKLDNLVGIVDRNMIQIDGFTEDILALEPYRAKWEAFGWHVIEIDGHDFEQIRCALKEMPVSNRPTLVLANTVKGKGISFMENNPAWHGGGLKGDLAEIASKEVAAALKKE
jgi:transketolase